jgi:hypothetical protein
MNEIRHISEILLESYQNFVDGVIHVLPKLFASIFIIFAGWVVARIIAYVVTKTLRLMKFDAFMERTRVTLFMKKAGMTKSPSWIVGRLIFWTFILLIFVGVAEAMGLPLVSRKIGEIINFIPNIFIAMAILVAGLYLAGLARDTLGTAMESYGVRSGRFIGKMVFYLITLIVCLTALDQLHFNIDFLTSNLMILIGGVALAFALGYGLSAREVLPNIISSYYGKNHYKVGQWVKIGEYEGKIMDITNISVVLKTETGKVYIPAKRMITEEVEVRDPQS